MGRATKDPKEESLLPTSSKQRLQPLESSKPNDSNPVFLKNTEKLSNDNENLNDQKPVIDFYLPLSSHVDDNPTITVYDEAKEMLLSAILMYGVVHLRALARKQLNQNKQRTQNPEQEHSGTKDSSSSSISTVLAEMLLQLPMTAKEVVRLVANHREDIVREIGRESTVDLYMTAFDSIQTDSSSRELELELNQASCQVSLVTFDIVVVEDERADNELVYAICVDTARRRITVSFRGCSCRKDWLVCCQTILKEVDNPLFDGNTATVSSKDVEDQLPQPPHHRSPLRRGDRIHSASGRYQSPKVSIHSGYYNYLFTPYPENNGETKFDSILRDLKRLLEQYPGYNIYVTGHSLGAALATVFTFHAAASGQLSAADSLYETPSITCINFASPMVGNIDFERAFMEYEDQGKIRCLRVTCYYDIFTQLPDRGNWLYLLMFVPWIGVHLFTYFGLSLVFFMWFHRNVYRHVGMNLHMYKGHKCWRSFWPFFKDCTEDSDDNFEQESNKYRYWYKIKHSHGSAENFVLRAVHDWKTHMKQFLQRLLAIPLLTDFDNNHRAHEHLRRVLGLQRELRQFQMKDLYKLRTPTSSPNGSTVHIPTNSCFV